MQNYPVKNLNNYEFFGISSLLFREITLEKALEFLKTTGLNWLDLSVVPNFCPHYNFEKTNQSDDNKLADLFKSYEFRVSSLNINPGYYNKDQSKDVDKVLIRAAQLANRLNTDIITIPSGVRNSSGEWLISVKNVSSHLNEISKTLFGDYGVSLSIETPHKNTLTETLDESVRFHEILNSQIIKCTLDTSHVAAQGIEDISNCFSKIGPERINHIHLRDARKTNISYTPGKGDIDYLSFFRKMKESNYKGKLIFELEYHDFSSKKKLQELQFAFNYISDIYTKNYIPLSNKIKTSKSYMFISELFYDPVYAIKQNEKIFQFLRKYKKNILSLFPEKVFEGKWVKRYRLNKNKLVVHKPGSVNVGNKSGKELRIGIIGLGYAGSKMHAAGYERLNNCRIVAGFDIDPKKREAFANRYKCNVYTSLEEMISKEKPDIVSICTREWLHYDAAIYCFENGVDVFCEKLMATKINDARNMVKTAKEYSRKFAVNYNYRFIPAIQKIKEIIEFKTFGKMAYFIINVHAFSYAHAIDLLSYLGGKIKAISASNNNDPNKRIFAGTDWDKYDKDIQYIPSTSINVLAEFSDGSTGIINSSIHFPLYSYIMSIEAVFEKSILNFSGMNMFDIKGNMSWYSKSPVKSLDMNYRKKMYTKGYEQSFYSSIESFIKNHIEDKNFETDGEQGMYNMMIEKYIHESSEGRKKIILD